MNKQLAFLLLLLTTQACLGPGIFKEKKEPVVEAKGTFTTNVNFIPFLEMYNPLPSSLVINFESEIDMSTVSMDDISVSGTGSCPNPIVMGSSITDHAMTILLNTIGCADGNEIKTIVSMTNIFDTTGKAGTGVFTQLFKLDTQSAIAPIINLTSGSVRTLPSYFTFLLDSSINLNSVTANLFDITGTGSCLQNPYVGFVLNGQMVTVQLDVASCQNTDEVEIALNINELWSIGGRPGIGRLLRRLILDTMGPDDSEVTMDLTNGWYNPLPTTADMDLPSDVNMDEVTIEDFMAVGNGTCSGNLVSGIIKTDHHVRLNLNTATCSNGNTVNFDFDLRNIKDNAGNVGSGNVTASMTLLTTNPQAPSFDIDSNIFSILPSHLTASFGSDVDMNTVAASISAFGSGACQANPLISSSNTLQQTSIILNTVGCQNGDRITLKVDMSQVKNFLQVAGNGIIEKIFTLDSIGPTQPVMDYESGSYNPLPVALNLQFESDTDMSSVDGNAVSIVASGSCPTVSILQMLKADKTLTLNLDTLACGDGDSITLSVDMSQIKDAHGNYGSGIITKTFTLSNSIPSAPSINILPRIANTLPGTLVLTFDAQIDMSTVSIADFILQGTGSCSGSSIVSSVSTGHTFSISFNNAACGDASSMILSLDMSGISTLAPTVGSGVIRYTYQLDKVGPASAIISPSSALMALLPQDIFITLPDDTNMSTVSMADFELQSVSGCGSLNASNISITGMMVKISVDSSTCVSGDGFTLKANMTGIEDLVGNAGAGSFQSQYSLDNLGPALASFSPLSNTFQALPQIVTLVFPDDTDMTSVTSADFQVQGTNTCQGNAFGSLVKTGQVATVSINTLGCSSGDSISVSLNMSGVTDLLGNPGTGSGQQVYTLDNLGVSSGSITVAPVAGTFPTLPTSIIFTLPVDMKMSTVDQSDFTASGIGHCSANALSSISKSANQVTLNIMTSNCVSDDTITITMNLAGTTDLFNNAGTGYVQQIYKLDNVGPTLLSMTPASQSLKVLPSSLSLTFPADTNMSSVTMADISIAGTSSCTTQSPASLSLSGQTATLSLDVVNCPNSSSVSVTFNNTGITDTTGNTGLGSTVNTYVIDTQGPASASVNLASATVKTMPATLVFSFPSDTDMTSVSIADFTASGSGTCQASALNGLSINGYVATLGLNASGCVNNNTITVNLDMTGVVDTLNNAGVGSVSRVFTLDTSGPQLLAATPASSSFQTMPASISYSFDSDTDMSSVTAADFTAVGAGGCQANAMGSLSISGVTATLNLISTGCNNNGSMTVTANLSGVSDMAGNAGSGSVVRTYTKDVQGPALATANLASTSFITLPSSLNYTFPSDTDMSSVTAADFSVVGSGSCPANANAGVSISGYVVTLNLNTSGCANNNTIVATLNMTGVADGLGNAGVGSVVRTFTMDTQGPASATVAVASGTSSALPTSLAFTFPSDTDMSSVTVADFSVVGSGSCPSGAGLLNISGFVATLNFSTAGCATGDTLSVSVNMSGVSDTVGNAGAGSVSRIFTLDNSGPALLSALPLAASLQSIPSSITYTFDADIDLNSITTADITVVGSLGCQANSIGSLTKTGSTVQVAIVSTGCVNASVIVATINMAGITDLSGNAGSGIVVRTYIKDIVGPLSANANIATGVYAALPQTLSYTFPSDTDMSSVTAADFTAVGTGSCQVNANGGVNVSGLVATLSINTSGCAHTNSIVATLSMVGVTDAVGNTGLGSVVRTFTLDNVAPIILSATPASYDYQVMPTAVVYTFAADTDMSTVTTADFSAIGSAGCPANAISSVSISGVVATLNMNTAGCVSDSLLNVTANLSGISDLAGNAGSGSTVRNFRKDTVAPVVPGYNALTINLVGLPTKLAYTFASDVDMSTVSAANFTAVGLLGCPAAQLNSVTFSGNVATVNLNGGSCGLVGTISVKVFMTGIKDKAGNSGTTVSEQVFLQVL